MASTAREQTRTRTTAGGARNQSAHAPDSTRQTQNQQHDAMDKGPGQEGTAQQVESMDQIIPTKAAVLDLTSQLNPHKVAQALRAVADETGEYGQLKFEFEALGKIGAPGVKGRIGGLLEMKMTATLNDQNFYNLQFDVEGAIKAGIELGGFIHADVEVGYGTDFVNMSFQSAEDAATYLLFQLNRLNELSDEPILDIQGIGKEPPEPAFEMHDVDTFLGAEIGAEFGDIEGEVSVKRMRRDTHMTTAEGREYHIAEDHNVLNVGLDAKWKGKHFGVNYNREHSNTIGSPLYYKNGVFVLHNLDFSLPIGDLKAKGGLKVTDNTKSAIMGAFMALDMAAIKFPHAQRLNAKLFSHVANAINALDRNNAHLGGKAAANLGVNIKFQWNEFGEADGTNNLMYFRVFVEPELSAEFEVEGGAGVVGVELETELSVRKGELVYEDIGSETVSYIQRQYIFEKPDQPWTEFVARNAPRIRQLVANCATPGFDYYTPEVEKAFRGPDGTQENHTAGLAALEQHWTKQKERLDNIKVQASDIAHYLDEANSMWTFRQSTREKYMGKIIKILKKFKSDPKMLAFLVDELPAYTADWVEIEKLAIRTDMIEELQLIMNKAATGGARTRLQGLTRQRTSRGYRWR